MKLRTIAIFGAGYVLGARAGQDRYDQIAERAQLVLRRIEQQVGGDEGGLSEHGQRTT